MSNPINLLKAMSSRCTLLLISLGIVLLMTGCASKELKPDMSAEQLYQQGKQHLARNDLSQAIKSFEALETRYPYGEYTDKGQLVAIYAYMEKEEFDMGLVTAERFLRLHPRHRHADYAQYMKGIILYKQNYSIIYRYFKQDRAKRDIEFARQAFDEFKLLIEKYPDSQYVHDAHHRMIVLKNQMASHELEVAKYYMKQKAYVAAANRASYLITHFPESPATAEALQIMEQAYQKLDLPEQATLARQTHAKNKK